MDDCYKLLVITAEEGHAIIGDEIRINLAKK